MLLHPCNTIADLAAHHSGWWLDELALDWSLEGSVNLHFFVLGMCEMQLHGRSQAAGLDISGCMCINVAAHSAGCSTSQKSI